jgi:hypothetical protein
MVFFDPSRHSVRELDGFENGGDEARGRFRVSSSRMPGCYETSKRE